ncbi:CAP domain-containing protein [Blastomonas sp.]|uniref:CAP domain-containing protein n=1 Tax=Blastomonas sp. TaxID=1909299 RepID=UPI0026236D68|nr:CAP domain-containing protein [Blastomonas sp.]MDM7957943.1 CAP domain-containing protein [Blastomonas sp.]
MHTYPILPPQIHPALAPKRARNWRVNTEAVACLLLLVTVAGMGLYNPVSVQQQTIAPSLQADILEAHNDARQQVGIAPMAWSEPLAAAAGAYASQMSRSGHFAHSSQAPGARPHGENLWMGTRGAYSHAEMAGSWVDEQRLYDGGSVDQAISTGTFGDTGHYTQIIWRGTKQVGCAVASDAQDDYLVCRYLPAGNVMGASPLD